MRLPVGMGVAFLLAAATAASAQDPVATVPLAVGEVLLEINANGSAVTRADAADISVHIPAEGADEAAMRRDYQRRSARISAAARPVGAEIEVEEMAYYAMTVDADMNAAVDTMDMNHVDGLEQPEAAGSAVIRLRNIARVDQLLRSIEEAGGSVTNTAYRTSDDGPARRQARANAIAAARADADAYAASLNMRVARMVRVTERTEVDFWSLMSGGGEAMATAMAAQMSGAADGREVPTFIRLGVDFILVPR